MKPLRTTLIPLSAMMLAGAPLAGALAQTTVIVPRASSHGDWTLKEREDWLDHRLDAARDDGSINPEEFRHVQDQLAQVRADEDSLRSRHEGGQLTDSENANLEARLDYIGDRIHWLRQTNLDRPW